MKADFLTIGIPTYNRVQVVTQHAHRLITESVPDVVRILIIDNASSDGTYEALNELCDGTPIRLLRNDSNLGYKGNYLRLFEECETEYLLVTSDEDPLISANLGVFISFLKAHRPVFVSPQFHHKDPTGDRVKMVRGRKEIRPIYPEEFMPASFNGSGLTYKLEESRQALADIMCHMHKDGQCYPQTLLAAELMLRGSCLWWDMPLALKLHHLPTTNVDPVLGAHNHVHWRWLQHTLFVGFFSDRISKAHDPMVKDVARQMMEAEHARVFEVLRDAIARECPDTLGALDHEARAFYARKAMETGQKLGTGPTTRGETDSSGTGQSMPSATDGGKVTLKMYVDESGIPYTDYGNQKADPSGIQHSVLAVAERGLWYWNEFNLSGCGDQVLLSYDWTKWPINKDHNPTTAESARTMLLNCADWLMSRLTDRGSHLLWCYDYPSYYGVQAGWGSAHAQAVGIQLLLRASERDGRDCLAQVEGLLRAFDVPIENGGLLDNSDPQAPWFEKFASPESQRPKVLNGLLFTLLGLHDSANRTGLEAARRQYEVGLRSALRLMERYDLGDWSAYNIQGKPASVHYHQIHIAQLDRLFRIEGDRRLARWRDRFASYESSPGAAQDGVTTGIDKLPKDLESLRRQLEAVRNSFSYRMGNMLVQAVVSPGRNTILLPYRLLRLTREALRRRAHRQQ